MNSFDMSIDFYELNSRPFETLNEHVPISPFRMIRGKRTSSQEMGLPNTSNHLNGKKRNVFVKIPVFEGNPQEFSLEYWEWFHCIGWQHSSHFNKNDRKIKWSNHLSPTHTQRRRPLLILIIVMSHHAWYPQLFDNIIIFVCVFFSLSYAERRLLNRFLVYARIFCILFLSFFPLNLLSCQSRKKKQQNDQRYITANEWHLFLAHEYTCTFNFNVLLSLSPLISSAWHTYVHM